VCHVPTLAWSTSDQPWHSHPASCYCLPTPDGSELVALLESGGARVLARLPAALDQLADVALLVPGRDNAAAARELKVRLPPHKQPKPLMFNCITCSMPCGLEGGLWNCGLSAVAFSVIECFHVRWGVVHLSRPACTVPAG